MADLTWEIVDSGFDIEGSENQVDVESPGESIIVSHSESMEVAPLTSVACSNSVTGYTRANQYLRTFNLPEFDISGDFIVNEVTFGVQTVAPAQDITVNLYTLDGELVYDNLDLIDSETVTLESQTGTLVTVPIETPVPAGSTLVAEIASTDMADSGWFYPGANGLGETAPSYLATTACEYPEPTPLADVGFGFPDAHTVMAVTGRLPVDCEWPEWLDIDPLSGTTPGGDDHNVVLTVDGSGLEPDEDYSANLCITSNDPDRDLVVVPLQLEVDEPQSEPTVPNETVPDDTLPEDTLPDETIPENTVPEEPEKEWLDPDPDFRFGDVADGHLFDHEIHWLAANGITYGCNPPDNTLFCPDDEVTRGQMAAFLVRALRLKPGAIGFEDTVGHVFEDDVAALAANGITYGCNPPDNTRFCPDDEVIRGQMAAFLYRALGR
ncbi:MAG: hypothetical protein GEU79_04145 [Acidimicrobiia bacterium]|nr:hypothetical protein [Acidimicrobiia bacterium]